MKKIALALAATAALALGACSSDADRTSENLSKAAEQFEVQRRIIGINGITDTVLFEVEGRCSIENENTGGALEVICEHAENDRRKHFVGLSDNVTYVAVQTEGLDVSEYRTRIVIKPENIVPDLDLVTG